MKTITKYISLLCAAIVFPLLYGCSGKPADFPQVAPCTVTVKSGGAPVADVGVFFEQEGGDGTLGKFTIKGMTNSSGVADIQTITQGYSAKGAPIGTFSVYLREEIPYPRGTKSQTEIDDMSDSEREAYDRKLAEEYQAIPRKVPERFSSPASSGLTITVESGKGGTLEVNVAEN